VLGTIIETEEFGSLFSRKIVDRATELSKLTSK
jgi:hypothetical protein